MSNKAATPDQIAKIWGELHAYRIMLRDLYGIVLQNSDDPGDITPIKERVYRLADEIQFPPGDEDLRSAAKVSLDEFWKDFEQALRGDRG